MGSYKKRIGEALLVSTKNTFCMRNDPAHDKTYKMACAPSNDSEALLVSTKNTFCMRNDPAHDKTYKMACAPSNDSDQPGQPPSLVRVFAVRSVGR